ncbi:hypothetical protein PROFUN_11310 [Planoprotostelium fungivorum]|uniref:Cytosol aminopeptidase domain-containing protein n=1 Tax=Planoprotostelium fungivorum TaxID=1890364 RepID=A0A2P6N2K2_9EUKA|nr:hypothetical protein PROFUN_11310 [Planoprotostelium fungivorum]
MLRIPRLTSTLLSRPSTNGVSFRRATSSSVVAVQKDATVSSVAAPLAETLSHLWKSAKTKNKSNEVRVFHGVGPESQQFAAVYVKEDEEDDVDLREKTREMAALGARHLRNNGAEAIHVDTLHSAHAAAEGAMLGLYKYNKKALDVHPLPTERTTTSDDGLTWETGVIYGEAQNMARELMETPANLLTPTIFSEKVKDMLNGLDNVKVQVHEEEWAREKNMGAFLSVTRGSAEPAKFVEMTYKGSEKEGVDVVLVGKGITFDTGGISIKPSKDMEMMRGDMGGAAVVASTMRAIARLKLNVNVVAVTPLCENMPSGTATKPGDVVTAMNGDTIQVNNTDAEGRLVLADALYYSTEKYKPEFVIDVATLTGAVSVALGAEFTGLFCSDDDMWQSLKRAGDLTHDRYWRMPLDKRYRELVKKTPNAKLNNSVGPAGGSCTAAAFLSFFVKGLKEKEIKWAHCDIAGVMMTADGGVNVKGMSGRGTRPLIEFVRQLSSK